MDSSKEQMLMMHTMCQNELSLLKLNLEKFIEESERCQQLLNELNGTTSGVTNIFGLVVFDRYMTQVVTVLNMARKFNIHLEINSLHQTVINASSNGCLEDDNFTQTRLLKDFLEWRTMRLDDNRDVSPCSGRIKMAENVPETNENVKKINTSEVNNNKSLVKYGERNPNDEPNNIVDKINNLLEMLLPKKCLEIFQTGYEFNAYIVYVRDYKKLEFFICQMDDYKTLYDLSSNLNYKPISREELSQDDVFFVLEKRDTTIRECLWRAVIVPDERSGESHKYVYLLDFGEVIPLSEHCTTYQAPLRYREIPPLAIKCILEGVEDSKLKSIITDPEKCEQALHKGEFERVAFRLVNQKNRTLHVVMLDSITNDHQDNKTMVTNYKSQTNPFLAAEELENDEENSSVNSAALQLPRSVVNRISPIKQPTLNLCSEIGDKLQIIVTHVVSPISFYGIIQNDFCGDYKTFSWHDHQIYPLQKQMSTPPQLNDILLSQYVKDNYWYRAKVIDIDTEKDLYKVMRFSYFNL